MNSELNYETNVLKTYKSPVLVYVKIGQKMMKNVLLFRSPGTKINKFIDELEG